MAQTTPHPHPGHRLPELRNHTRFPDLDPSTHASRDQVYGIGSGSLTAPRTPPRTSEPPFGAAVPTIPKGLLTMTTNLATKGRGWAYTGAGLGGLVSIAANVAHSYVPPPDAPATWEPHLGAVVGAVFWPLALFLVIEIFARTIWPTGWRWYLIRFGGLLPVAALAAIVSYRHLSGLLSFYGEDPLTAVVGPLAVDGLMVMATGALVATGQHAGRSTTPSTPAIQPGRTGTVHTDTGTRVPGVPVAEPAPVPANLIPTARFAATNHYATTGQPITAHELAARRSLPAHTARRLLDVIATTDPTPTPAAVNGASVTSLAGGAR